MRAAVVSIVSHIISQIVGRVPFGLAQERLAGGKGLYAIAVGSSERDAGCGCGCGCDLQVASFLRAISRNCLMSVTSRGMVAGYVIGGFSGTN